MQVLPASEQSFIETYEHARTIHPRIPSQLNSDGFTFNHPLYLLHLGGKAGAIVSEQTHEIASLFSADKGKGREVVKTAIAFGGTWLYTYSNAFKLIRYYHDLGFEDVAYVPSWDGKIKNFMTYLALPGHEDDVVIKHRSGCTNLKEYKEFQSLQDVEYIRRAA